MTKQKTNFPQIPVEQVKKIARRFDHRRLADDNVVIFESPSTKTEPYATAVKPANRRDETRPEE